MANPFNQSNPFDAGGGGAGGNANPFADPSVTSASQSNSGNDSNPFNASAFGSGNAGGIFGNSGGNPSSPPPPEVSVSNFTKPTFTPPAAAKSTFGGGEEELRKKELELAQREQELIQRERQLAEGAAVQQGTMPPGMVPANNWPKCAPILYMNIKEKVHDGRRWIVWQMYIHWFVTIAVVALNVVGIITYLSCGIVSDPTAIFSDVLMCLAYLVLVPPVSFALWYYPFYVACSKNSAMRFFPIFITLGIHVLFLVTLILGIPSTGMSGFIRAIVAFIDGENAGGIIILLLTIGYVGALIHAILLYISLVKLYRAAGGRAGAKREAAEAAQQAQAAAAPHLASAAKYGMNAYVQSQMGGQQGGH